MAIKHSSNLDDESADRQGLAKRLREAREYLGFSQDEVSKHLGIARSALSNIENAERKVDALELKKLAQLYEQPVGYFTGDVANSRPRVDTAIAHLARKAAGLSPQDQDELARFADFLRARKEQKGG